MIVGVPWRGGDPWRERSFHHVASHLAGAGCEVITADVPGQFNRAASRNLAVHHARSAGAQVVVLHDADMLCPSDAYRAMGSLALSSGRLVVGYTQYRALSRRSTLEVLDGADPWAAQPEGTTEAWSVGGVVAITPGAWEAVGGMDPRFAGWGGEDFAFAHAASLVLGPPLRVETPAVHLWHPHGADHPEPGQDANGALLARYMAAGSVAELRDVQEGADVASERP